jgi:hypothetical protein
MMPNDIPIPPHEPPPTPFMPGRQNDRQTLIDALRKSARDHEDAMLIEALAVAWGIPSQITQADADAVVAAARSRLKHPVE